MFRNPSDFETTAVIPAVRDETTRRAARRPESASEETRQIPIMGAAAGLPRRSDARGQNQGQGQGQGHGLRGANDEQPIGQQHTVHLDGRDDITDYVDGPGGPSPLRQPPVDQRTELFTHTGGAATTSHIGAYQDDGPNFGGGPSGPNGPDGPDGPNDPDGPSDPNARRRTLLLRGGIVAAAVLGLAVLLYGADLLLARGDVPRGVVVAGVDIGGLDRAAAEQKLRDDMGPRLSQPVQVRAGDVESSIDPITAGLALDWSATIEQAGDQPLNPWTRLRSLFGDREVEVVTLADQATLTPAVEALRGDTDREPVEGNVQFDGATPVAVDPKPGQTLDVPAAVDALKARWADGETVELPVQVQAVRSTPDSVRAALETIAQPAVSGPVTIQGEGGAATLEPAAIAAALRFEVGPDGALNPLYDNDKLIEGLRPQLAETEEEGKDASVALQNGTPVVTPSVDGRGVDWPTSLTELPNVLKQTGERTLTAAYTEQPAKFTTEQANALGIKEVVAEFQTGGFAADSGVNIRVIAAEVNGAMLKPGETFSLNTHTGPRGSGQGYVEAGIIDNGKPGRAVGGGCSQFATTLFNAAYFAGLTDVAHKEHSYFISRYPEAREATVFEGVIDLAFKNDFQTGILIETIWTPSSIKVRIWGTKTVEVESVTGERTAYTSPQTVTIPPGERCSASNGSQGFTVSNTRIVRNLSGTEISRNNRRAVYNPQPKIVCAPAPAAGEPPPPGG